MTGENLGIPQRQHTLFEPVIVEHILGNKGHRHIENFDIVWESVVVGLPGIDEIQEITRGENLPE